MKPLSPKACADKLGVTGAFIRGEIREQRLKARVHCRPSGRCIYRIEQADFDQYVEQHWPNVPRGTIGNTHNTGNTGKPL